MKEVLSKESIKIMDVTIPPARENIGRVIGVFIGFTLTIVGILMMISIILILQGIGFVLVGLLIAVLCTPKANIKCPACTISNKVALKAKQLKCDGCNTITPLKWKKP